MLNFSESGHPVFRGSNALEREALRSKRKGKFVYTFLWWRRHSRLGSSRNHFRQSAQYLRSSSGHMRRTGLQNLWLFRKYRETQNNSEIMVMPTELSTTNKTLRTNEIVQGNLLHDYEQKIAHLPDHLRLTKLCSNEVSRRLWRRDSVSRPSTMRNLTNWEAHVESTLHIETNSSSKVKGGIRGKTKIGPALEVAVSYHQGRHGTEAVSKCQEVDQIASTRSFSTSRTRRSSRIQNLGTDVSFRIRVFSALFNSDMADLLAKRRRSQEEISVLCGSILCWYHIVPSSNSRSLWRKTRQSYIATQRVVTGRLRRAHQPRWKLPRYALDHSIGIDSGWQRRQEREMCGVLCGREPNVHRSLTRKGLRRDEAQDCSVQTQL